jgi:hypothetical protein
LKPWKKKQGRKGANRRKLEGAAENNPAKKKRLWPFLG